MEKRIVKHDEVPKISENEIDQPNSNSMCITPHNISVLSRSIHDNTTILQLSNGETLESRRFIPVGKGDYVRGSKDNFYVFVKNDRVWLEAGRPWHHDAHWDLGETTKEIRFKEIETESEFSLFEALRKFHYRGGGGIGRTVPIIAVTNTWDLPCVLGFIEISSSMIANTARKKFLDYPYREKGGLGWLKWDRASTIKYSNVVARISRFVIHPEIRGLGLARLFLNAAIEYTADRWHYGGFKPRFLEITADMLRYYRFVGPEFVYMGNTQGNEHRISKDMAYLVKKALSPEGVKAMPQGGGGIMTMQRGYALQMLKHMETRGLGLTDVVSELRYEPEHLDQETWEALYRLNRRPKPCYITGLTTESKVYIKKRARILEKLPLDQVPKNKTSRTTYSFFDVSVHVRADMAQSNEARRIQDAFGFVGARLEAEIIQPISFTLCTGTVTLICGASGSGKSLLGRAIRKLCARDPENIQTEKEDKSCDVVISGYVKEKSVVIKMESLNDVQSPLEQIQKLDLDEFVSISAKCGLAEPQLFVRPTKSLSSGQRYRMQLACAFLKRPEILYIDNFCETLDRLTALAVCKGLKSLAVNRNVAVVVSTAAYERIIEILNPDQLIALRRENPPIVGPTISGIGNAV